MSWSPVTESNRRPSPYHVPLDGSRGPGTASDQVIRWHKLAGTNLNQRRQAPFCLSNCPQAQRFFDQIHPAPVECHPCSSASVKPRVGMQELRTTAPDQRLDQLPPGVAQISGMPAPRGHGSRPGIGGSTHLTSQCDPSGEFQTPSSSQLHPSQLAIGCCRTRHYSGLISFQRTRRACQPSRTCRS